MKKYIHTLSYSYLQDMKNYKNLNKYVANTLNF